MASYILLDQYADQWAAEDTAIDQIISEQKARNNGKPPNIIYILADDLGYGDIGHLNPDSKIPTPEIDQLAKQGISFILIGMFFFSIQDVLVRQLADYAS